MSRWSTVAVSAFLVAACVGTAAVLTANAGTTANPSRASGPQPAAAAVTPSTSVVPASSADGVREVSSGYNSGYLADACCARPHGDSSFTAVSGTFNVPRLVAPAIGVAVELAVGLEGTDGNGKLIEAGVGVYWDGTTEAWWDTAATTLRQPITLPINAGDRVTITIEQPRPGTSRLRLTDHTSGRTFTTEQRYSASGEQAFWLVRDQPVMLGNAVARFAPRVSFTNLRISTANGELRRIVQRNPDRLPIVIPSTIGSTGFTVGYRAAKTAGGA